jgi:restriction endonuclease Mrr
MNQPTSNIPDFQSIMLPMLKLLENGEVFTLNEVISKLAIYFNLTAEEINPKL